jgi:hypothetical protein
MKCKKFVRADRIYPQAKTMMEECLANLPKDSFLRQNQRRCALFSFFLKVAAPWGRGDLSAAASGYSISGFAIADRRIVT